MSLQLTVFREAGGIAIASGGTFISARFFLTRSAWRNSINRIAESMTLFGAACAGIYPISAGAPNSLGRLLFRSRLRSVLSAVLAGFIAFLVVNLLPRLYHPVDEASLMRGATRDRWCVAIRAESADCAHTLLRDLSADTVEELPAWACVLSREDQQHQPSSDQS